MSITDSLGRDMKRLFDLGALGTFVGAVVHALPAIALILTIAWYATRLYEYGKQKYLKYKAKKAGVAYKEEQIPG